MLFTFHCPPFVCRVYALLVDSMERSRAVPTPVELVNYTVEDQFERKDGIKGGFGWELINNRSIHRSWQAFPIGYREACRFKIGTAATPWPPSRRCSYIIFNVSTFFVLMLQNGMRCPRESFTPEETLQQNQVQVRAQGLNLWIERRIAQHAKNLFI